MVKIATIINDLGNLQQLITKEGFSADLEEEIATKVNVVLEKELKKVEECVKQRLIRQTYLKPKRKSTMAFIREMMKENVPKNVIKEYISLIYGGYSTADTIYNVLAANTDSFFYNNPFNKWVIEDCRNKEIIMDILDLYGEEFSFQ